MQHDYTRHPLNVTPEQAATAAGLTLTGPASWERNGNTLSYQLPGVGTLTADQKVILDLFADYKLTGAEKFPGLLPLLIQHQGLTTARNALMAETMQAGAEGNPIAGLLLEVAQQANAGLNELRETHVPFENLIAQTIAALSPDP